MTPHKAWRVAFIVPFIVIVCTAIAMLLLCPDTPTGKWSERHLAVRSMSQVDDGVEKEAHSPHAGSWTATPEKGEKAVLDEPKADVERGQMHDVSQLDIARGEVVVAPTFKEAARVLFSLQTMFQCLSYFCTFGAELAINSILGAYYLENFKSLGQTGTGNWAAMFGLLNVATSEYCRRSRPYSLC
jgi:MFS transporter, NNP family, nitrate/nitrite transporter